ncbi:MAG: hypothetical protein ACREOF_02920 [Gemmatimonadales bacterium]
MQCTQKAFTGLVALILAAATPALAQDTTTAERTPQPGEQQDTLTMPGQGGAADTAGFSGMERNDPTGAAGADTSGAAQADTPPQESQPAEAAAGQSQDPNGFRWTLPSDFANAGQTPPVGATDAVQPNKEVETGEVKPSGTDSTKWGRETDTDPEVQNPPGYRGMERDTTQVPPGAAPSAETPTSRTEQAERQSDESGNENPPGYRGMEQPAEESDSTKN